MKCRLCSKPLKDESATLGPDCQARYDEALLILETTPAEIAELALNGSATVQRWLRAVSNALVAALRTSGASKMRGLRDGKAFVAAARRAYAEQHEDPAHNYQLRQADQEGGSSWAS